jgi:putative ABC transport system permease protein
VDRDLPVTAVRSMQEVVARSFGQAQLTLWLLSGFAVAALLLASVGIYGLLAYTVEQRRQEMGVRRALGAQSGDILGLVLRQSLALTLAGVVLGLAGSVALTRALTALLFHVSPTDPLVFGGMAALFLLVASVASYLPARRALHADPLTALRG